MGTISTNARTGYNSASTRWGADALYIKNEYMYVVINHRTLGVIQVFKSTDYGDNWTLLDDAHSPAHSSGTDSYDAGVPLSGPTGFIYVAYRTATNTVRVRRFDTSTDLWETTDIGNADATTVAHNAYNIRVSVRSDGDVLLLYRNSSDNDLYYTRYEGSSWVPVTLNTSNTSIPLDMIMTGNSNMAHVIFFEETALDVTHVSISDTNVLGTVTDVDATAAIIYNQFGAYALDPSGPTHRIGFPLKDSTNEYDFIHATSTANPTFTTVASLTPTTTSNPGEQGGCVIPYNNKWYVVWSTAGGAIYWDVSDDYATPAFGTDQLLLTASNANPTVFGRTHTRGVPVIVTDAFNVSSQWIVGPTNRVKWMPANSMSGGSGGNVMFSPTFADNVSHTFGTLGAITNANSTYTAAIAAVGNTDSRSLVIDVTASTETVGQFQFVATQWIYGDFGGRNMTLEAYTQKTTTARRGSVVAYFYNNADTYLGAISLIDVGATTGSWVKLATTANAPAGATKVIVYCQNECRTAATIGTVWYDDIYVGITEPIVGTRVVASIKTSGAVSPSAAANTTATARKIKQFPPYTGGSGAALVNSTQFVNTTAQTTHSLTGLSTTTGNTLVLMASPRVGSSGNVSSITDSAGNTWTLGYAGFISGSNSRIATWYAINATAVTSIDVTLSNSYVATFDVMEWSGIVGTGQPDTGIGQTGNTAGIQNPSAGSVTTTFSPDVLVAGIAFAQAATITAVTSGWTIDKQSPASGTTQQGQCVAYQIASSTGIYECIFTTSINVNAGGATLALKATTGGASYSISGIGSATAAASKVTNTVKTSGAIAVSGDSNATAVARKIQRRTSATDAAATATAVGRRIQRRTSANDAIATATAIGRRIQRRTSANDAVASVTSTGHAIRRAAATISAEGVATAIGREIEKGQSALDASGSVTAIGHGIKRRSAALDAISGATATGHAIRKAASVISAEGVVAAIGREIEKGQSVLDANGAVTALGRTIKQRSSALDATSAVIAIGGKAAAFKLGAAAASAVATTAATSHAIRKAASAVSAEGVATAIGREIKRGQSPLDASGTATAVGRVTKRRSAALSVTATTTATSHAIRRASSAISAEGVATAVGREIEKGQALLDASGAVTAVGRTIKRRTSAVSGDTTLSAIGTRVTFSGSGASVSATATTTALATRIQRRASSLSAAANSTAIGRQLEQRSSLLTAMGSVTATARVVKSRASAVSGISNLTVVTRRTYRRGAAAQSDGTLFATAYRVAVGQAVLSANGNITANGRNPNRFVPIGGLTRVEGTPDIIFLSRSETILDWEMTRTTENTTTIFATKATTLDESGATKTSTEMPPIGRVSPNDASAAIKTSPPSPIMVTRTTTDL